MNIIIIEIRDDGITGAEIDSYKHKYIYSKDKKAELKSI